MGGSGEEQRRAAQMTVGSSDERHKRATGEGLEQVMMLQVAMAVGCSDDVRWNWQSQREQAARAIDITGNGRHRRRGIILFYLTGSTGDNVRGGGEIG